MWFHYLFLFIFLDFKFPLCVLGGGHCDAHMYSGAPGRPEDVGVTHGARKQIQVLQKSSNYS